MKPSPAQPSPIAYCQSRSTPNKLEDLKKLNPRTQAVILGKAIAMRNAKDTKLRIKLEADGDARAGDEGQTGALTKAAL